MSNTHNAQNIVNDSYPESDKNNQIKPSNKPGILKQVTKAAVFGVLNGAWGGFLGGVGLLGMNYLDWLPSNFSDALNTQSAFETIRNFTLIGGGLGGFINVVSTAVSSIIKKCQKK